MYDILSMAVGGFLGGGGIAAIFGIFQFIKSRASAKTNDDYSSFIEQMTDGYYRSTLDGKQITANPALVRLNGYDTKEEMLSAVNDIASEWYVEPGRRDEFIKELNENGQVERFTSEIYRHKTREKIWISESARLVFDPSGRPCHFEGTIREVTDTMRRLELEETYRKFTESVPGVLFQARWSSDGKFSLPYTSNTIRKLLGDVYDDSLAQDSSALFKIIHPDDYRAYQASAEESVTEMKPWIHEYRIILPNGKITWLGLNAMPEMEPDGSCVWHGFLMDITHRKTSEEHIHNLAFYDSLTELPNRRQFLKNLESTLENCCAGDQISAVMFIDLDNFKTLNDTRGHWLGDILLQKISKRLVACIGDKGIVARFGGDEFVILLENIARTEVEAKKQAEFIANSVMEVVDKPCHLEGGDFQTTGSIGMMLFNDSDLLASEVLRCADMAMYASKENGKNCVTLYDSTMLEALDYSANLAMRLGQAISKGELVLHFQKQVDKNGNLIGAEALPYWHHSNNGSIAVDQLITLAEQSGNIASLNEWVLQEAFKTLACWKDDDCLNKVKLSVRVCAFQLHDTNFTSNLEHLAELHGVDPSNLIFAMAEDIFKQDTSLVGSTMSKLRELGVGFSLCEIGAGYSSLVHLRDLPFSELKIDRKLVSDLSDNPNDQVIVSAIIFMAKTLGFETVADCVETNRQQNRLRDAGCTKFQGCLYGSAAPIEEFGFEVRCSKGAKLVRINSEAA